MPAKILIVDDEPNILSSFSSLLHDEKHRTVTAASAEEAQKHCNVQIFDLILLDLQLPGQSGLDFLKHLREDPSAPKVLVISGQADIPAALEAVRLGAVDFLEKPVAPEKLIASVSAALALVVAENQRRLIVQEIDERHRIVGESLVIKKLNQTISQVAPTDTTVLITGENGTGKELVATRLQLESTRRDRPFIKVNCPGIPESLFESQLFGHVKGSFTGAVKNQPGKFVQADGGTLFLDEIGDLPIACQAKLLRVLETGEVEALGSEMRQQVDVRVICATNRDLPDLISEGKFRQDLYYRISVFVIEVPLLASRTDDIPLLVGKFLKRFDPPGNTCLSAAAIAYLQTLQYPGNVRQLKNIIERLTIIRAGRTIEVEDIMDPESTVSVAPGNTLHEQPLVQQIAQYERRVIECTLRECKGNISEAARQLQVDRAHLSRKIKDLGLKPRA